MVDWALRYKEVRDDFRNEITGIKVTVVVMPLEALICHAHGAH